MKCTKCGSENNENAKYCNKCGEKIVFNTYENPNKNRITGYIPVIMISIILILILVVILIFRNPNLSVTINNTESNKISQESSNNAESNEYKKEYNNSSNDTNDNMDDTNNIQIRKLDIIDQESTSILTDSLKKDYGPYKVLDGYKSTVWAEGISGPGYGEGITLYLDSVHTIKQLKIVNGLVNSSDGYYKNNRVASIMINFHDGTNQIANLMDDNTGYQVINLNQPVQTSCITITIDSVYSGYKYDDTCIAEVIVLGY